MSGDVFDLVRTPLRPGTTQLEASAGTGKTYTITGIVLRLLLEGAVDELTRVLVVTFTVAATEELKTRLRRALRDALAACEGRATADPFLRELGRAHGAAGARKLRAALATADEMSVSTIHGFCARVLDEAAFETSVPFRTEFVEDELPLLAEAARDALRIVVTAGPPLLGALAVVQDFDPDALLREFRAFDRLPDTQLRPEPAPFDAAVAALRAAVAAAAAAFDDDLAAQLDRLELKRDGEKSPIARARGTFGSDLRARLQTQPEAALPWLCACARSVLEQQVYKNNKTWPRQHPFLLRCDDVLAATAAAGHALRARLFAVMGSRLQLAKARANSRSFQDLQVAVHGVLRDADRGPALRRAIAQRWQAALIDEFQDTDPLQYEIFSTCFGDRRLMLVGDPKQSIYGFRGADVHAYLRARDDAAARHTLGSNYRSHPELVAAVGDLFAGPAAFVLDGIDMPAVQAARTAAECGIAGLAGADAAPLQLRWLPPAAGARGPGWHKKEHGEQHVLTDVADECVRLLSSGLQLADADPAAPARPLRAGDIAVLTRTNAQATAMQDELRRRGVHSAIGKAGDVFKCPEMAEMLRLLTAVGGAGYTPHLRAAWTTLLWGMTAADLQRLDDDADRMAEALARAHRLRRTWVRHGFIVMFQDLLHETAAHERLLRRPDGERKLTNYLQIAELLHHAEMHRQLAPESLVQWLQHERRHAEEIDYQLRELRLESDDDAVQILTVHGSKGLQYEVVFVPFAWAARQHGAGPGPVVVRDGAGAIYDCAGRQSPLRDRVHREELAEDLRLLYVALTRARRRCYVHWLAARNTDHAALAWLLHGPGRAPDTDVAAIGQLRDVTDAIKARLPQWRTDLDAFAAGRPGGVAVADLDPAAAAAPAALPARPGPALAATRRLPRRLPDGYRIASFSSLLQQDRAPEPRPALEAADDDAADAAVAAAAAAAGPTGLFAFARGARAGVCLHEILELADFAAVDDPATAELVRSRLWRHGLLEPAAHRGPIDPEREVLAAVRAVARDRLGALPFRLEQVAAAARVAEWEFFVRAGALRPRDLAAVFRDHGGARFAGAYADRLAALPAAQLHGFLRGFVDLVCEHDGRYWVLDWKSNHLGDRHEDYAAARLLQDVQDHDYVLQYHLYLLALHRHLAARLPGYDYDRHVGGACYVYLRGLGGPSADAGVFCDAPPRALIAALDGWLTGEAAR